MPSAKHGVSTSVVEVTNVSTHGLWLLIHDREIFLPFENFPWFREAAIGQIVHVELLSPQHLYWPDLDVDLELESILHPERYPLVSKVHEESAPYASSEDGGEEGPDRIDEAVLALLQLTLHDGARAWKGFDFEVMDRLYRKGYILDPRGQAKSVVLTDEGLARSKELFVKWFGQGKKRSGK
jgi:Domain of unknown function (DUF6429)/Protein of unknown function (DUF2442)